MIIKKLFLILGLLTCLPSSTLKSDSSDALFFLGVTSAATIALYATVCDTVARYSIGESDDSVIAQANEMYNEVCNDYVTMTKTVYSIDDLITTIKKSKIYKNKSKIKKICNTVYWRTSYFWDFQYTNMDLMYQKIKDFPEKSEEYHDFVRHYTKCQDVITKLRAGSTNDIIANANSIVLQGSYRKYPLIDIVTTLKEYKNKILSLSTANLYHQFVIAFDLNFVMKQIALDIDNIINVITYSFDYAQERALQQKEFDLKRKSLELKPDYQKEKEYILSEYDLTKKNIELEIDRFRQEEYLYDPIVRYAKESTLTKKLVDLEKDKEYQLNQLELRYLGKQIASKF